jgi:hypothetical protein
MVENAAVRKDQSKVQQRVQDTGDRGGPRVRHVVEVVKRSWAEGLSHELLEGGPIAVARHNLL